ncbi:MAG: hypothetical protein K2H15_09425, partial [Muribaculaceae bacterium]|nr:hypothetical protein [Muribaculaceae bacterium]
QDPQLRRLLLYPAELPDHYPLPQRLFKQAPYVCICKVTTIFRYSKIFTEDLLNLRNFCLQRLRQGV